MKGKARLYVSGWRRKDVKQLRESVRFLRIQLARYPSRLCLIFCSQSHRVNEHVRVGTMVLISDLPLARHQLLRPELRLKRWRMKKLHIEVNATAGR